MNFGSKTFTVISITQKYSSVPKFAGWPRLKISVGPDGSDKFQDLRPDIYSKSFIILKIFGIQFMAIEVIPK